MKWKYWIRDSGAVRSEKSDEMVTNPTSNGNTERAKRTFSELEEEDEEEAYVLAAPKATSVTPRAKKVCHTILKSNLYEYC